MRRPATVADIMGLEPRDTISGKEWTGAIEGAKVLGDNWCSTHTVAIYDERHVYAVLGFIPIGPGRFGAFALVDKKAVERPVLCLRESRRALAEGCSTWNVRRLEINVDPEDEQAEAFARSLGFEHEGFMRSFHEDGSNAYLMARIP